LIKRCGLFDGLWRVLEPCNFYKTWLIQPTKTIENTGGTSCISISYSIAFWYLSPPFLNFECVSFFVMFHDHVCNVPDSVSGSVENWKTTWGPWRGVGES
jgi:hypothetical protein